MMRYLFLFILFALIGCGSVINIVVSDATAKGGRDPQERVMAWPKDWSPHVGQTVTLEGTAVNVRLGAMLQGQGKAIWIDGLDSWPKGFYSGGDHGKSLRVTGTVIKKDDLPVFVQKPDKPPPAGIPVQSEAELEKEKWRYLLKDARWTVIE